uniref:Uncharacterized protein n=1 Tax=Anguilla anguilla TaxID=7936 RepID=A0A0E9PQ08_ANGAN
MTFGMHILYTANKCNAMSDSSNLKSSKLTHVHDLPV